MRLQSGKDMHSRTHHTNNPATGSRKASAQLSQANMKCELAISCILVNGALIEVVTVGGWMHVFHDFQIGLVDEAYVSHRKCSSARDWL